MGASNQKKIQINQAKEDGSKVGMKGSQEEAAGKKKAKAWEIWDCFKRTGKVLDIILPRKRDKKGKRFGFVKTISELEAGTIILNAKENRGLGSKIKMSLNGKQGFGDQN
ncbi:hypothetical protein AgCh_007282 [Apium graveolens]